MPHSDTKGDVPIIDPKPPGGYDRPGIGGQLPGAPDNTLPGGGGKPGNQLPGAPDQSLPGNPIKPGKPAPLPGGGVRPDNALPEVEEPESFDEVQSGGDIPDENIQMLIAGTLGGSGDNHASAKRIVERMHQAEWVVTKALDAGSGDTAKARKAKADKDEADAKRKA
jgi:hypothetical protein